MSVSTLKDRGKNLSYLNIKKKTERFSILTSKIAHRLLVVSDKIDIQITGKLSQLVKNSSSGVLLNTGKQLSDPMRFAHVQRTLAAANLD